MLDARLLGGVGEILALRHFTLCADRPEILYAVDAINAAQTAIERRGILHVALHDLNALLEKRLRRLALGVAGEGCEVPPFSQHVPYGRSALFAGRARDQNLTLVACHDFRDPPLQKFLATPFRK